MNVFSVMNKHFPNNRLLQKSNLNGSSGRLRPSVFVQHKGNSKLSDYLVLSLI